MIGLRNCPAKNLTTRALVMMREKLLEHSINIKYTVTCSDLAGAFHLFGNRGIEWNGTD